ncbi:hypothetical protein [Streptomyces mobaraensis]|uniref:Uncharacterized protein n=1 Tax=Streptomyces mobaraensis TaxID=35621 RepID=A0A5N5W274_STRMB|nr:hypothetical protein [Streptomyces mobaraensis]KAB7836105.1 hypothetical protein FRZ00_25980 [Streptomyces mobaraensis]
MTRKLIHRAAMAGAALTLGLTGALAAGASAVAAPSGDSSASRVVPDTRRYIDLYESKQQCQGGGAYFMRHGATHYECYDVSGGWELWIWE